MNAAYFPGFPFYSRSITQGELMRATVTAFILAVLYSSGAQAQKWNAAEQEVVN